MGPYKLLIKRSAEKDFKPIPKKDRQRLVMNIRQLPIEPRPEGAEKLKGSEFWRVRQGDWRIIYGIDDEALAVTIERVGHRREVYR